MMEQLEAWVAPALILVGGVVLGMVLERIVLVQLGRKLTETKLRAPRAVVDSTRGATAELVMLAAAYVAVARAPIGDQVEGWVRDGLFVVVVLIVTILVARLSAGALRVYMERPDGALPATSIFINIIRATVFVIGLLVVLQHFGVSITPIVTAMGVSGLAVALALQDTLSSLFAGLQILAARQIKPGDFIRLESGESGEVVDVTWRNTIVRALPNNEIIIPNSKMASSIVTNYQLPVTEMSVLVQCGVAYGSDLEKVERVVLEVAGEAVTELEGEFEEWEPLVRFHTFGDSSVDFTIVLRAREFRDQYELKHEFIKRLKARFDSEGIEIPFPQRVLHQAKGAD